MVKTIFLVALIFTGHLAGAAYNPIPSPLTVTQGGGAWAQNLTQLGGLSFSASNYLPARITNGTSYVDPTLIRALTSADVVSAAQSGTWTVAVSNAILPTGAATSALQTSGNSTLTAISGQLPSTLGAKTTANSLAVNIASDQAALPLPTGASTAALQTTGNTSLASIDTKLTSPLTIKSGGKATTNIVRNDYTSTSVTTGAYVQLVASTSAAISEVEIFDSSGQTLVLATGGAGSEVNQVYITPGGNGRIPLSIASGTRVSIKAVSATASAGEIDVNFYQ